MPEASFLDLLNKLVEEDRMINARCKTVMQSLNMKLQHGKENQECIQEFENTQNELLNSLEMDLDSLVEKYSNLNRVALEKLEEYNCLAIQTEEEIQKIENKLKESDIAYDSCIM